MKTRCILMLSSALLALPLVAAADPWKDEGGHGHREFKEKYWDGNCMVERKLGKHGEYKEKRKCKGPEHGEVVYAPAQPAVVVQPGITIQGAMRIPQ